MKSHLMCAIAFGILFTFLILFIPLFLIYAHLEELNMNSSFMTDSEELKVPNLSVELNGAENDFNLTQLASLGK